MTNQEASIIIGNIPIDGTDDCYSITEYQEAKAMAIEALKQKPKGNWIETEDDLCRIIETCSICGYGSIPIGDRKFCPNCGADMRG